MVRLWPVGRLDGFTDKSVEAVGKFVVALIAVERWREFKISRIESQELNNALNDT